MGLPFRDERLPGSLFMIEILHDLDARTGSLVQKYICIYIYIHSYMYLFLYSFMYVW